MTRDQSSVLFALADLQDMERERSDREIQQQLAQRERRRHEEQLRERLALEESRRKAAEEQARRTEAERQRAWEEAEARRRVEEAEARARAEQNARLAEVQRELSAELGRRQVRRTVRWAAMGMGVAMLSTVALFGVWMGTSQPAGSARVATDVPDFDTEIATLSRELERMRQSNDSLRGDVQQARARAEAAALAPKDEVVAEAEPPATKPPEARPHRPRPRPKSPPASKRDEPLTKKRANPLVLDDSDLLAGLEKKPKK